MSPLALVDELLKHGRFRDELLQLSTVDLLRSVRTEDGPTALRIAVCVWRSSVRRALSPQVIAAHVSGLELAIELRIAPALVRTVDVALSPRPSPNCAGVLVRGLAPALRYAPGLRPLAVVVRLPVGTREPRALPGWRHAHGGLVRDVLPW